MKKYILLLCYFLSMSAFAQNSSSATAINDAKLRNQPKNILLLWDTSLPMSNRALEQELELLRLYVSELEKVKITASKFGSTVYEEQSFNCDSSCDDLFNFLRNSTYNGASNYAGLLQNNKSNADLALVFTNGISPFEALDTQLDIPVFTINSKTKADHLYLFGLSKTTGGSYVNLAGSTPQQGVQQLLYQINGPETYANENVNSKDLYYGVVHNNNTPIQGALVRIKNTFNEVQTESNGRYKISAKPGDILEISALGMIKKEIALTETKKTHVPLDADGELLDEVLLQKKRKEEESKKTAFGDKSRSEVGYLTQDITKDQISLADINAFEVLKRQQGIEEYQGSLYFTKAISINRTPILIEMDGIPVDANILKSLDARLIEKITQLKTLASTVRYGSTGVGGVILIATINSTEAGDIAKRENNALVKGNEYTETVPTLAMLEAQVPKSSNLQALEKSGNFEAAKELYFKQLRYERNSIEFYLDAAKYFERWNAEFSSDILSNIAAVAPKNVKALKILAYSYEENGSLDKAKSIYEQIVNLQPQDAQSYRDLAIIYAQTGEHELAATLYRQMVYNTIPNVDFAPVQDIVFNEFRHLIKNHKSQINYKGLPNELLSLEFKKDIRFVLEWNHPATEFDVQIVSPDQKYFGFSHTAFNNKELLQNEIDEGFFMKEFIIDDGEKGPWMINIRSAANSGDVIPLILKYTLYTNYGKSNETKVVKTVPLTNFQDKFTLDSFVN